MKSLKTFLFVSLVLIVGNTIAQTNYKEGYVVTLANDTLRGLIDYQDWDRSPAAINFKSRSGNVQTYTPLQLKTVAIEGVQFCGVILPVEITYKNLNKLSETPTPSLRTDTTFIELLTAGELSLYYYKDKNASTHFFYSKPGGELKELSNYIYLKTVSVENDPLRDQRTVLFETKRYLGQLNSVMYNCKKITIKNQEYTISDLRSLFEKYNTCVSPNANNFVSRKKTRFAWVPTVFAGVAQPRLSFDPSPIGTKSDLVVSSIVKPVFGIGIDLVLPVRNQKWIISNDIGYRSFFAEGEEHSSSVGRPVKTTFVIETSAVQLANNVIYQFGGKKIAPFIVGGICNSYFITSENNKQEETQFPTRTVLTESEVVRSLKKIEFGFTVGTGATFNKNIRMEFRYEIGNGISNARGYAMLSKTLLLTVRYRFVKPV